MQPDADAVARREAVTSAPTSATTPAISWPGTAG